MPGEPLLIGIATIAVAIAGFTAVAATLVPPGGAWHPAMRTRQRAIVSTSFNVVFEALAPSIAFLWLGDVRTSIVLVSAVAAVYTTGVVTWRARQFMRAGDARNRGTIVLFTLGPIAAALFWVNAFVAGSVAVYALALCIQSSVAAMSFYQLVSAAGE